MRRIGMGMQEMRWECGCGESAWDVRNLGGNVKNVGSQGSDEGDQGGNFSIAVEMT